MAFFVVVFRCVVATPSRVPWWVATSSMSKTATPFSQLNIPPHSVSKHHSPVVLCNMLNSKVIQPVWFVHFLKQSDSWIGLKKKQNKNSVSFQNGSVVSYHLLVVVESTCVSLHPWSQMWPCWDLQTWPSLFKITVHWPHF